MIAGNVSIADMTQGMLSMRVAALSDPRYILMTEEEKRAADLPVSRREMLAFIVLETTS